MLRNATRRLVCSTAFIMGKHKGINLRHFYRSAAIRKDIYTQLNISTASTPDEIKIAFSRHLLQHNVHPDLGGDASQFRSLLEARNEALKKWEKFIDGKDDNLFPQFLRYAKETGLAAWFEKHHLSLYVDNSFVVYANKDPSLLVNVEKVIRELDGSLTSTHLLLLLGNAARFDFAILHEMLMLLKKHDILTASNITWTLHNLGGNLLGSDKLYLQIMKQVNLTQALFDLITHPKAFDFIRVFAPRVDAEHYHNLLMLFKQDPLSAGKAAFRYDQKHFRSSEQLTLRDITRLIRIQRFLGLYSKKYHAAPKEDERQNDIGKRLTR